MRTLKNFLEARMPRVGFSGPVQFAKSIGITFPTYLRAVRDDKARAGTREMIAEGLKFREWSDLLAAHAADDITWGLTPTDITPRMPPVPARPPLDVNVEPFIASAPASTYRRSTWPSPLAAG